MKCSEVLRVQAYFDGELAPAEAAAVDKHLETCADCRVLLVDLERGRAALRKSVPALGAPLQLRANILRQLDAASVNASARTWNAKPFWWGAFAGAGIAAIAASLFLFMLLPMTTAPLVNTLVAAHLQSLKPDQLISVLSSDHHTVKPWFAGHADVSPTVVDLADQGFTLTGGRADQLLGQRAAVTVYRHGKHTINVFAWPDKQGALPRATTRNGYHLLFWKSADIAYCAVSDTAWEELEGLQRLLQAHADADLALTPR